MSRVGESMSARVADGWVDHTRGDAQKAYVASNRRWARKQLAQARGVDFVLMSRYKKTEAERGIIEANRDLRESVERLRTSGAVQRSAAVSDWEIKDLAKVRAKAASEIASRAAKRSGGVVFDVAFALREYCESFCMKWPARLGKRDSESRAVEKLVAASLRVCCEVWWRRQIKTQNRRRVESEMLRLGEVGQGRPYISNWGFARVEGDRAAAQKLMKQIRLVRMSDQLELPLADVSARTVANPAVRLAETIVRAKGLQELAEQEGKEAIFFTLTAPARFHARPSTAKGISEKWQQAGEPSPRDAAQWLQQTWARVRARWKKHGIDVAGIRVAEPHKDACPHYHMMVFCDMQDAQLIERIFRECALSDSPTEPGAQKRRCDAKRIDNRKGSAVGYLVKYLAKGLTGEGVGDDVDTSTESAESTGVDAVEGAARVRAWASLWGIRQYQFFGIPPVGPWRELRRLREPVSEPEMEEARIAADRGRYGEYLQCARKVALKVFTMPRIGMRYGLETMRTVGVWVKDKLSSIVVTRKDQWEMRPMWEPQERTPVDFLGRCTAALVLYGWELPEGWGAWAKKE